MELLVALGIALVVGGLLYAARSVLPVKRQTLGEELRRFFGGDVVALPILSRAFSLTDLPNIHLGITEYVEHAGAGSRVVGYSSQMSEFHNSLRTLMDPNTDTVLGSVQYREVDIGSETPMQCVENGIHLIEGPEGRVAAHVRFDMFTQSLQLEVMASDEELGKQFLEGVRERANSANVYRGKILSLEQDADLRGRMSCGTVRFHRFQPVGREEIVLPEETLELVERNTVRFFRHAGALRGAGRSLKRGLLLHGKPGVGKTLTARWLAQSLPGATTILLSGEQLGMVKECCRMARMLAPALVIMEDVDLIASERDDRRHPAFQISLHQLMNEMDGLDSEAEVIFILTTNRPEAIETALAARPGRIDQAIEFPLPDAACRRRLLELYGRGLTLELEEPASIIGRTEGASPAFIKELLRKAALIAAEESAVGEGNGYGPRGALRVTGAHLDAALRELVFGGGELTRNLLGFACEPGSSPE